MAVDEYGRESGVDYSDQSWTVNGIQYTSFEEAQAAMELLEQQQQQQGQ